MRRSTPSPAPITTAEPAITEHERYGRWLALLLAWFSPACPVGAFSYSHGLERLEADGALPSAPACREAIATALVEGSGRNDCILLAAAWRATLAADGDALAGVAEVGLALAPSGERWQETVRQGNAFAELVDAVWPGARSLTAHGDLPYPVAVGAAGALHNVPLRPLVEGFALAFVANLVSAAVRLVPLGQTDGQRITAELAPLARALADEATGSTLDDLGGAALGLDLASMRHECQEVRLFRS